MMVFRRMNQLRMNQLLYPLTMGQNLILKGMVTEIMMVDLKVVVQNLFLRVLNQIKLLKLWK